MSAFLIIYGVYKGVFHCIQSVTTCSGLENHASKHGTKTLSDSKSSDKRKIEVSTTASHESARQPLPG